MALIETEKETCSLKSLALKDAIEVLGGKWKICILQTLSFRDMRFKDLQENVTHITPKVLSKELQELEMNHLVKRTVNNTKPVTVTYSLTEHAYETKGVIDALIRFGEVHRKKVLGK